MVTRAAIYARVSSLGQRDRNTIEGQLVVLTAYAKAQGWELAGTYVDDGRTAKSGHLEARDGFAALVRAADSKAFDVLVVVDVDRLTRTDSMEERAAILGPFQRNGIDIVTPSGGRLDLRSFLGELYATIQALGASDWLRKHKERIAAAKAVAISKGKKPAGPTPLGWHYARETGVWSIDPSMGPIVREVIERVAAGDSCETIARDFDERLVPRPRGGQWHREAVWKLVTQRTAIGEWTADKRKQLVIKVPPIVDVALWERANRVLAEQGRRGLRRTKHVYLLEAIAVCACCGARICISSAGQVARFRQRASEARYVCKYRRRPARGAERCQLPPQRTADVDERLWASIVTTLQRKDLLTEALGRSEQISDEHGAWERDQEDAARRLARLDSAAASALARHRRQLVSAAALDVELAAIARERKMLERQAETARRALAAAERSTARAADFADALAAARAQLAAASPAARRHVVAALFEPGSIVVGSPEITATLRLHLNTDAGDGHADGSSTSSSHVTSVEFRLVA